MARSSRRRDEASDTRRAEKRESAGDALGSELPGEWAAVEETMPGDPFFSMGAAELAEVEAEKAARDQAEKAEAQPETDDEREMRGEPPAPAPTRVLHQKTLAGRLWADNPEYTDEEMEILREQTAEERQGIIRGAIVSAVVLLACVVAIILLFVGRAQSV